MTPEERHGRTTTTNQTEGASEDEGKSRNVAGSHAELVPGPCQHSIVSYL